MPEVQIKLSALWVALMLTYLLGDVLRFWSGDATPGQFGSLKQEMVPAALMFVAVLMLIPIVMVVVSVTLSGQTLRWVSVIAAVGLFAFNVIGLPTYSGLYDKFLIVVGLGMERCHGLVRLDLVSVRRPSTHLRSLPTSAWAFGPPATDRA